MLLEACLISHRENDNLILGYKYERRRCIGVTMCDNNRRHLFTCSFLVLVLLCTMTPLYSDSGRAQLHNSPILESDFHGDYALGSRVKLLLKPQRIPLVVSYFFICPLVFMNLVKLPIFFVQNSIFFLLKRLLLMPIKFTSAYV